MAEEHVAEEQPSGNHIANEPKLISEMDFDTTENEESFRARDHLPKLKPQSGQFNYEDYLRRADIRIYV